MLNPFRPTYFTNFYYKYPIDRPSIMELNRDLWSEKEKANCHFFTYAFISTISLLVYKINFGPLHMPPKYGKILGLCHSIGKLLVPWGISATCAYYPYHYKWIKTDEKLKEIDVSRME